jgi:hypothetical protein
VEFMATLVPPMRWRQQQRRVNWGVRREGLGGERKEKKSKRELEITLWLMTWLFYAI